MNIVKYHPRRSPGDYSTMLTEPVASNCFRIIAQVLSNSVNRENI